MCNFSFITMFNNCTFAAYFLLWSYLFMLLCHRLHISLKKQEINCSQKSIFNSCLTDHWRKIHTKVSAAATSKCTMMSNSLWKHLFICLLAVATVLLYYFLIICTKLLWYWFIISSCKQSFFLDIKCNKNHNSSKR